MENHLIGTLEIIRDNLLFAMDSEPREANKRHIRDQAYGLNYVIDQMKTREVV